MCHTEPPWQLCTGIEADNDEEKGKAIIAEANEDEETLVVYTDGSKDVKSGVRRVGAGAAVYRMEELVRIHKWGGGSRATIFDAEMMGLAKGMASAVEFAEKTGRTKVKKVVLATDNESALLMIRDCRPHPAQIFSLMFRKHADLFVSQGGRVHLVWVRAHKGMMGNEMADALAKEARELPTNEFGGATVSWKKERAKAMITKNWRMAWRERRGGSASAGLSVLGREPSRSYPDCMETIANAPRRQAARTIQVLLGHGWFGEFYECFNLNGNVECACGAQRETRDHILLRCPLFVEHRHILWRGNTLIGMYDDFIFSTKEGKLLLLKFLEKTDAFFKRQQPPEDPDSDDDNHPAEGPQAGPFLLFLRSLVSVCSLM
jgi:ribonuclease HI